MSITINQIEVIAYNIPMKPFAISLGTLYEAKCLLVKITTNNGLVGWGEGSPFPMIVSESQASSIALAKEFAEILIGKPALQIEENMQLLHNYIPAAPTTKSAFDMALYDVAAKAANQPLFAFLGGKSKTLITDETVSVGDINEMVNQAVSIKDKGAKFIKVKVGKGNQAQKDIDSITAIRENIGKDIALRLDANQGWSIQNAITVLTALENYNIQFCEQPVAYYDYEGLKTVKNNSPIKIMADEACFYNYQAEQLIKMEACDYINIKLAKSGGILEANKIAKTCAKANMQCMLGGMIESKLALTANAHLACAHDNIVFYDLDFCFPHTYNPVTDGVNINGYELSLNNTLGIGAYLTPQELAKYKTYTFTAK
jgi:L-Ala-D/L-Glu epimerase